MIRKLLLAAILAPLAATGAAHVAPVDTDPAPITREEALARADRLFDLLDTNHDGILQRHEAIRAALRLRARAASLHRDIAPGIGGHTAHFYRARFARAQTITLAQFEQAMLDHFDAMDANHDGVLTADERQAKGPKEAR